MLLSTASSRRVFACEARCGPDLWRHWQLLLLRCFWVCGRKGMSWSVLWQIPALAHQSTFIKGTAHRAWCCVLKRKPSQKLVDLATCKRSCASWFKIIQDDTRQVQNLLEFGVCVGFDIAVCFRYQLCCCGSLIEVLFGFDMVWWFCSCSWSVTKPCHQHLAEVPYFPWHLNIFVQS